MNAIFQFFVGDPSRFADCMKSVRMYCARHGIKYYSSDKKTGHEDVMFEKYQALKLFTEVGASRVCYIDADVLVTPHAANIFDAYPDPDYLYAYDENDDTTAMNRDIYIYDTPDLSWPINAKGKKQYFNAGVMLFSKQHAGLQIETPPWVNVTYFGDQTPVNYTVVKHRIPFRTIDYSFNRMHLGMYDHNNERYKANFIHYAGACTYGNGNKIETMVQDYKHLYGK